MDIFDCYIGVDRACSVEQAEDLYILSAFSLGTLHANVKDAITRGTGQGNQIYNAATYL